MTIAKFYSQMSQVCFPRLRVKRGAARTVVLVNLLTLILCAFHISTYYHQLFAPVASCPGLTLNNRVFLQHEYYMILLWN